MSGIEVKTVTGKALEPFIPDLARLRIEIFRDYPYLYAGSEAYEAKYLRTYIESDAAMAVLAFDNQQVIGASTGVPMAHESAAFKQPFIDKGIDPETVFYCGESVLLPAYRGRRIYRQFFMGRETYARSLGGMDAICFCAVVRPDDHPRRPPRYRPLDAVWRRFGYLPRQDLVATFPWTEVGASEQTAHAMMFWIKGL